MLMLLCLVGLDLNLILSNLNPSPFEYSSIFVGLTFVALSNQLIVVDFIIRVFDILLYQLEFPIWIAKAILVVILVVMIIIVMIIIKIIRKVKNNNNNNNDNCERSHFSKCTVILSLRLFRDAPDFLGAYHVLYSLSGLFKSGFFYCWCK